MVTPQNEYLLRFGGMEGKVVGVSACERAEMALLVFDL